MSRRKLSHGIIATVFILATTTGCWEQWSEDWFPQMKWQKAVQAFESVDHQGQEVGFSPAEGAVPVSGIEAPVGRMDIAATDALVNPRDPEDFRSLENGQQQYDIYCWAKDSAVDTAGNARPNYQTQARDRMAKLLDVFCQTLSTFRFFRHLLQHSFFLPRK